MPFQRRAEKKCLIHCTVTNLLPKPRKILLSY